MKLIFAGADRPIDVARGYVSTVEVENSCLFARMCRSLVSNGGEDVFEQFSLWDEAGNELVPSRVLFAVPDPLHLPWDCTELSSKLFGIMETLLYEDEEARRIFEDYGSQLRGFSQRLTHQVECDYRFNVEWDVRRYLKSFGFSADRGDDLPYIDMLNMFLDFVSDVQLEKVLVFVNLKTFLGKIEFEQFLDRVFFHEMQVLLLENKVCDINYGYESKMRIDQHFLEI